jgi:hypothetical protein
LLWRVQSKIERVSKEEDWMERERRRRGSKLAF